MSTIPPEGSEIGVDFENGFQKVVIHQRSGGVKRFFLAAFLIFWLGGWVFGWISVAHKIVVSERSLLDLFLLIWIGGWTIVGILLFLILYRLLRPSVPETLILSKPHMMYDSGIAPLTFPLSMKTKKEMREKLLPKRIRTEFNTTHLSTLRLRKFDLENRLTIDTGNKRIDIGSTVSESEREWLYNLINSKFSS